MIHNYQQVYLESRLENPIIQLASATVAYFRAPLAGTIKSVKIWAQTTSGAQTAKFSFLKNGVGQFPAPNYIEFASGASFIEKPNLTMAVAVGDVLAFDLIQVSSGGIPAPITFQIEIDDGDTISPAEAYDAVKAIIVPGTNVTETADDTAKTLTIAASGGGGGAAYDGGRPDNTNFTNLYFREDFLGGNVGNSNFALWAVLNNGSGGQITGQAGHPGIYQISAAAGVLSGIQLRRQTDVSSSILPIENFEYNWIFRPNSNDANTTFRLGLGNTFTNDPPNHGIYIEKKSADSNLFGVCRISNVETRVDLGAFTATNWYLFTCRRIDASTIGFAVNGGTELTITTNIPTIALWAQAWLAAVSVTKTLDIDYFDISITGLTRF